MIHQAMRRHRFIGPSLLLLLPGCVASMQEQLEQVAKDWSMVIRASQVVPVYPLSEDLQPGDMFVVQVPIERQHELWNDKGYLPLDQRVARLQPSRYAEFYARSSRSAARAPSSGRARRPGRATPDAGHGSACSPSSSAISW